MRFCAVLVGFGMCLSVQHHQESRNECKHWQDALMHQQELSKLQKQKKRQYDLLQKPSHKSDPGLANFLLFGPCSLSSQSLSLQGFLLPLLHCQPVKMHALTRQHGAQWLVAELRHGGQSCEGEQKATMHCWMETFKQKQKCVTQECIPTCRANILRRAIAKV